MELSSFLNNVRNTEGDQVHPNPNRRKIFSLILLLLIFGISTVGLLNEFTRRLDINVLNKIVGKMLNKTNLIEKDIKL